MLIIHGKRWNASNLVGSVTGRQKCVGVQFDCEDGRKAIVNVEQVGTLKNYTVVLSGSEKSLTSVEEEALKKFVEEKLGGFIASFHNLVQTQGFAGKLPIFPQQHDSLLERIIAGMDKDTRKICEQMMKEMEEFLEEMKRNDPFKGFLDDEPPRRR